MYVHMYICMYVCMYVHIQKYIYIYIYIYTYGSGAWELVSPRPRLSFLRPVHLRTKSFDFRGFDSSRLLILKGGNSRVRVILQGVSRKA